MPTILTIHRPRQALSLRYLSGGLLTAIAAVLLITPAPAKADVIWDITFNTGPVQGSFQIDLTNGIDTNLTLPGTFVDYGSGDFNLNAIPSTSCGISLGGPCDAGFQVVTNLSIPATAFTTAYFASVFDLTSRTQVLENPGFTAGAAVPEPSSLSLLIPVVLAFLARRRFACEPSTRMRRRDRLTRLA